MAVRFHPLPVQSFPKEAQSAIARFNVELAELFALEGLLRNPTTSKRSDNTIARRNTVQVDVSRITPPITAVVSGSSTVVGTPALVLSTTNVVGTTTTALATNSTIALFGTASPIGSSTTAAVGTSALAARSDHRHPHAEALMVDGTAKTLILTDGGAAVGALVTAANTFSANYMTLMAPNATNSCNIGKFGNITLAGATPLDTIMMNFSKADYNESAVTPSGVFFTLTNTNIGAGTVILAGLNATISGTCSNASAPTTRRVIGSHLSVQGGNTTDNNFTGALVCYNVNTMNISEQTAGTSVTSVTGVASFDSAVWTRPAVADLFHFRAQGNPTLVSSATLGTHTGYRCEALTNGNTRYSVDLAAITTGTPAIVAGVNIGGQAVGTERYGVKIAAFTGGTTATGIDIAAHSGGTTRRAVKGGDSIESSKHLISGVSGFGCIVADTVDGNYYIITTASGVIGASSIGTALPSA